MSLVEINFDGIVGPSHNYAGLSLGNIASASHKGDTSYPRAAFSGERLTVSLPPGVSHANERPRSTWKRNETARKRRPRRWLRLAWRR